MKMKKIIAFVAAVVMAMLICTGVPTSAGKNSLLAVTSEATIQREGTMDIKATYDGTYYNIKWSKVKSAAWYGIFIIRSLEPIPFDINEFSSIEAATTVENKTSVKLEIDNELYSGTDHAFNLDEASPYGIGYVHYGIFILSYDKNKNIIDGDDASGILYFDKPDELKDIGTVPVNFKSKSTENSITLTWDAVDGADLYRVYKYNEKTKKYEKYKDVKNTKCTITGLKSFTEYKIKVASYDKVNGKYVKGETSNAVSVRTK